MHHDVVNFSEFNTFEEPNCFAICAQPSLLRMLDRWKPCKEIPWLSKLWGKLFWGFYELLTSLFLCHSWNLFFLQREKWDCEFFERFDPLMCRMCHPLTKKIFGLLQKPEKSKVGFNKTAQKLMNFHIVSVLFFAIVLEYLIFIALEVSKCNKIWCFSGPCYVCLDRRREKRVLCCMLF